MNLTKAQLAQKVRDLESENEELDVLRERLKITNIQKQDRIEYLERENKDLKNKFFDETERFNEMQRSAEEWQLKAERTESRANELVRIKNHHEAEAAKWRKGFTELEQRINNWRGVKELEAKIASLEAQLADARDTADRMAGDLKKYKQFYDDQRAKHWGWNNQQNTIRTQQSLIKGKDALIKKLRKEIEELNKKQSIKDALKTAIEAMQNAHVQHANINIAKKLNEILEAVKPKEKGVHKSNGPGTSIVIDDPKISDYGTLQFGARFTPPEWLRKIESEREKAAEKQNQEPTLEDHVKALSELYTALRKNVANNHISILNLQNENERLRAMCEDLRKTKADKWRLW